MLAQKKILLSAYACTPGYGSEGGTGWNVVKQIGQYYQTWVITRADRRDAIERELSHNPLPNVHWIYYDLPTWARFWRKARRGQRVHYYLWQIGAYLKIYLMGKTIRFDLVHHITYIKYSNPSFLSLLPSPFVWGPVGGAEAMPDAFYRTLDTAGRRYEHARNIARAIGELDPFVRLTARRAQLALATTPYSAEAMRRLGANKVYVVPGIALSEDEIRRLNVLPIRRSDSTFRLLSVGQLLGWKGFHLGLQAFALLKDRLPASEYWIIGDGPQQEQLRALVESLDIGDRVKFFGWLPRDEVLVRFGDCDALVHPSLHDSGGWVCLEAMAAGRPVICLDVAGPSMIVTEDTGFKVQVGPPQETIRELSNKMYVLATDSDLRLRMAEASRQRVSKYFSWNVKCQEYIQLYEEVINQVESPS